MQPPVCALKVEWFMLKSEYWIKQTKEVEELIFNMRGGDK